MPEPIPYCPERDAISSYNDAVTAVGEQVRSGMPVPSFFRRGIPGRLTPVAFELPDNLPFERWAEIGTTLRSIERSVLWWVGDWLRYGEPRYGEKYAEAVAATDYSYQSLANAKWVTQAFAEISRRRENLSFAHHAEVAALPVEQQDELLDAAAANGWSRQQLRAEVYQLKNRVGLRPTAGDTCDTEDLAALVSAGKTFGTIYADPPWLFDNQTTRSATSRHYRGLTVDELCELPVRDLAARDAHLHLWTVNAFLFDAPRIFDAWGFEFKSSFVWVKRELGIGNYWRSSHEILLTAIRGNAKRFFDHSLTSWLHCSRGEHSSKPEQVRAYIQRASPGPFLELFGRRQAAGWTVWGNEIARELFVAAAE